MSAVAFIDRHTAEAQQVLQSWHTKTAERAYAQAAEARANGDIRTALCFEAFAASAAAKADECFAGILEALQ